MIPELVLANTLVFSSSSSRVFPSLALVASHRNILLGLLHHYPPCRLSCLDLPGALFSAAHTTQCMGFCRNHSAAFFFGCGKLLNV